MLLALALVILLAAGFFIYRAVSGGTQQQAQPQQSQPQQSQPAAGKKQTTGMVFPTAAFAERRLAFLLPNGLVSPRDAGPFVSLALCSL